MASDDKTDGRLGGKQPRGKKWYWLAGGVAAIMLLAAGAWQAWSLLRPPAQAAGEVSSIAAVHELERRLAALERRLETVSAEKRAVVPVASNEWWWIAETERYLVEAGERLKSGADAGSILSALKSARRTIGDLAAADAVREALDREIQLIGGYRNDEAVQALSVIDRLLAQLQREKALDQGAAGKMGAEPQKDVVVSGAQPSIGAAQDDSLWGRLSDGLAERFRHLVVVQRKDGAGMRRAMRGVVVHSLVLARTAVLGGDNLTYRYALTNAMQAVEQSGEIDTPLHGQLRALHALDIAGTPPRIGEALDQIRALAAEMTP